MSRRHSGKAPGRSLAFDPVQTLSWNAYPVFTLAGSFGRNRLVIDTECSILAERGNRAIMFTVLGSVYLLIPFK
jgi:hypothetical protein